MTHLRLHPAKKRWLEALLESDATFTERSGIGVAEDWTAGFEGIIPHSLGRIAAGNDPTWGMHLFFDDHVDGGALVGNGGWKGPPVDGVAELGYAVAPAHRGKGIAGQAVEVLLAEARRAGLHTVVAHTLPELSASTSVLARKGFANVGEALVDGEVVWRWERAIDPDEPVRMHTDEVATDVSVVRRLLRAQQPQWGELPVRRVPSAGTDNAMYRLGDDLAVRLPRIDWALESATKEQRWLPALAPHLPVAVPRPVALGEPTDVFPYPWTVVEWVPGSTLDCVELDPFRAAEDLAVFLRALRSVDPAEGPRHRRGGPLRHGDAIVRVALDQLDEDEHDVDALRATWEEAVAARPHEGPPTWFHGDLSRLNLLAAEGGVSGVIDWGCCGVGDPAVDLLVAWSALPPEVRPRFRAALEVDDDEWARARGWVVSFVFGLEYYRYTNPQLVTETRRAIDAVLADDVR